MAILTILKNLLCAIPILCLFWNTAQARNMCTDRDTLIKGLANKYSEAPVSIGLASNGGVIEVLKNKSGSSWTILISMPNGMTCLVAAGENWRQVTPKPKGEKS